MAAKRTWHREEIKAALRQRYGTLSALSAGWGYHPHCVSNALARHGYSPEVERRVAQALGTTPYALWPERWTPRGQPVPASKPSGPKATPAQPLTHRQIRKAA